MTSEALRGHLSLTCVPVCSARIGNLRDSGIDLLKVGIPQLSTDSGIDRIGCSILELAVLVLLSTDVHFQKLTNLVVPSLG